MNEVSVKRAATALRRPRSLWWVAVVAILGVQRLAVAAPSSVSVQSAGTCPEATAIVRELERSLANVRVVAGPAEGSDVIQIVDAGETYTVIAGHDVRTIEDPRRDCDERARVAAVFAAIALDPPVIEESEPPALSTRQLTSPPQETPRPVLPAARAWNTWLSAGGLVTWSGSSYQSLAAGPEVGLGFGRGMLQLQASAAVTTPSTLRFGDARAEIVRLPVSAAAYLRTQGSTVEASIGLGLTVEGMHVVGRGGFTPHAESLLQLGIRTAAQTRIVLNEDQAVFCAVTGTFVPSTHELMLIPDGVIGSTPAVWLGLTLGVTIALM